mmetsp:Transcript_28057/g.90728  ORF Transcript_28057/g.90728 Transcript_28057/m.90728 type:complete len:260 (+) Transcript_28057:588-1367(+)
MRVRRRNVALSGPPRPRFVAAWSGAYFASMWRGLGSLVRLLCRQPKAGRCQRHLLKQSHRLHVACLQAVGHNGGAVGVRRARHTPPLHLPKQARRLPPTPRGGTGTYRRREALRVCRSARRSRQETHRRPPSDGLVGDARAQHRVERVGSGLHAIGARFLVQLDRTSPVTHASRRTQCRSDCVRGDFLWRAERAEQSASARVFAKVRQCSNGSSRSPCIGPQLERLERVDGKHQLRCLRPARGSLRGSNGRVERDRRGR